MDLAGKNVVVTGADGFIGSHLTEALVAGGCRVKAFVHTAEWLAVLENFGRYKTDIYNV